LLGSQENKIGPTRSSSTISIH